MIRTFKGIITDTDDPEQRGRVRFASEEILPGDEEYPDWAEPTFAYAGESYGEMWVPPIGSVVDVEIEDDDDIYAVAGGRVRWRCGVYATRDDVPQELRAAKGAKQGIVTPVGAIVFDGPGNRVVVRALTILLGSENAAQALVLGNALVSALQSLVNDAILKHTHSGVTTGPGVTGIVDVSTIPLFTAWIATNLTAGVFLSKKHKTE